jgi:hypothetical protein
VRNVVLARVAAAIFLVHAAVTLALGYLVIPQFETVDQPLSSPASAPAIAGVARVFYFPIVSQANNVLAAGFARPGIGFVVLNSALVAALLTSVAFLAWPRNRAVASHGVAADSPPSRSLGPLASRARLAAERPTVRRPEFWSATVLGRRNVAVRRPGGPIAVGRKIDRLMVHRWLRVAASSSRWVPVASVAGNLGSA